MIGPQIQVFATAINDGGVLGSDNNPQFDPMDEKHREQCTLSPTLQELIYALTVQLRQANIDALISWRDEMIQIGVPTINGCAGFSMHNVLWFSGDRNCIAHGSTSLEDFTIDFNAPDVMQLLVRWMREGLGVNEESLQRFLADVEDM